MTALPLEKQLADIRAKCIETNPVINDGWDCVCGATNDRPIRLADVLLAIMKAKDGTTRGVMKEILLRLAYLWNCFADDLTKQSPETIQFVHSLLV